MAGRVFLVMIGAMLLLVGGVFEWLMIRSFLQATETRSWPQVQARVLRSEIEQRRIMGSPKEVKFEVLFEYHFEGESHISGTLSPRGPKWTRHEAPVLKLAAELPVGSTQTAWVNPGQPSRAILKHDTKAAGYTLWFPALIMLGGCGIIWSAFKKEKRPS